MGGWDEKETQDKIFKYSLDTQQTSFVGFLPQKVEGHTIEVIDAQLFIIGGFDGFGVTDKIVRVDLKTMKSEVLEEAKLTFKRENHTSSKIAGDVIVIAGGWNGSKSLESIEAFKYIPQTRSLE